MRFIWTQQWTVVPVIMGDQESAGGVSGGRLPGDPSTLQEISEREIHPAFCKPYAKNPPFYSYTFFQWSAHGAAANVVSGNSPFESHLQRALQQPQDSGGRPLNIQNHYGVNSPGNAPSGAFHMSDLGGALPESQPSRSRSQLYLSGQQIFGTQQIPPFTGQTMTANTAYNHYPQQYSSTYQRTPPTGHQYPQPQTGSQAHSGGASPGQATYAGQQYLPNQGQLYVYYPGEYGQMPGPHQGFQSPQGPYSPFYNRSAGVQCMTRYFPQQEADPNITSSNAQTYSKHSACTTDSGFNSPETCLRLGNGLGK